jgi:hypothetical protein
MGSKEDGELQLAATAASAGATSKRAQALLEVLRRVVSFDGAWLALADTLGTATTHWRASTWMSRRWISSAVR